ncbi:MAG: hypothetical protein CL609_19570 [Anaerolineaceae bacterium]|nr:hypothetical protein [Anaerolineaceae bacterium]
MKSRRNILIFTIWILVLILPYVFGFLSSDHQNIFLGFLINPIDGLSYLAKMNQGAHGNWLFHLPYSSLPHPKVFLFSFYILIGKISELFFGDLQIGFHFFRILCAIIFFHQINLFVGENFGKSVISFYLKLGILFGGGLGWLYLLTGDIPADFWVAEAFPFLSAFVNPHFIFSLALLVYILRFANKEKVTVLDKIKLGCVAFILANISPFAVVIGGLILFGGFLWDLQKTKHIRLFNLMIYSVTAAPILIYQIQIVRKIEPLISWNAQNITPAPKFVNFIFSFSPFLVANLFLLGLFIIHKLKLNKLQFVLLCWLILAMIFVYLPLDLQRRFLVGFFFGTIVLFFSLLTTLYDEELISMPKMKRLLLIITILIIPSNLILLTGAVSATAQQNENLFVQSSLIQVSDWLNEFGLPDGVVLTEEQEGLILPAFTYQRVMLGHPFETPEFEITLAQVNAFFADSFTVTPEYFYEQFNIDYVLINKIKWEKLKSKFFSHVPVFENDDYLLFQVHQ